MSNQAASLMKEIDKTQFACPCELLAGIIDTRESRTSPGAPVISLSARYSCHVYSCQCYIPPCDRDGVWVNFIARARTAVVIKDERMHSRARILERPMATRANARQWVEKRRAVLRVRVCVRARNTDGTDKHVDDMWKCCSDCTGYCGNAAVRFIHAQQNISCKPVKRFSVDYARKTLCRLKSSGYQTSVLHTSDPLFETVAALLRRKRKRVIYNFNYVEFASRLS